MSERNLTDEELRDARCNAWAYTEVLHDETKEKTAALGKMFADELMCRIERAQADGFLAGYIARIVESK